MCSEGLQIPLAPPFLTLLQQHLRKYTLSDGTEMIAADLQLSCTDNPSLAGRAEVSFKVSRLSPRDCQGQALQKKKRKRSGDPERPRRETLIPCRSAEGHERVALVSLCSPCHIEVGLMHLGTRAPKPKDPLQTLAAMMNGLSQLEPMDPSPLLFSFVVASLAAISRPASQ